MTLPIFTVGHSTRTPEEFLALLRMYGVTCLADVRTAPRSRRVPQFNRETLPAALATQQIAYRHLPGLGGFRRPRPDSPNLGLKHKGFRGYADYMLTEPFEAALRELLTLSRDHRVAAMCAEAVPWRCHRSLLADALTARGVAVEHILSATQRWPHQLTTWACRHGEGLVYPAPSTGQEEFWPR